MFINDAKNYSKTTLKSFYFFEKFLKIFKNKIIKKNIDGMNINLKEDLGINKSSAI